MTNQNSESRIHQHCGVKIITRAPIRSVVNSITLDTCLIHYGVCSWGKYRVKAVEHCKPETIWNFSPLKFARAAPTVSRTKAVARTLLDTLEALYYLHNNCVCVSACGFGVFAEHPHSFPSSSSTQQGPSHDDSSGDQNVSHGLGRHLKLHSSRSMGHQIPHDVCVRPQPSLHPVPCFRGVSG